MNIVILHCHYQRGGVTQVVENHVRWLSDDDRIDRIFLCSGSRVDGLSNLTRDGVTLVPIKDFDYDSPGDPLPPLSQRSTEIQQRLLHAFRDAGLRQDNTILHWHNHSLGKNTAAPGVIGTLAESGWRQLLQIHDFAEDNRPDNYGRLIEASRSTSKANLDSYLYPLASHLHYSTLTRADAAVLTELGIPDSQAHWLPNSVTLPETNLPAQDAALAKVRQAMGLPARARWSLYPVRGIRRKNVGEWVLLSRWLPEDCYSGLTLMPTTPIEQRSYLRWRDFARDHAPRAIFDAGHHESVSFMDNLAAADVILSTSVAEGFGMTFLEPWLAGREVIARRLPTISSDFESSGVQMPKFYDQVLIPGEASWIGQCYQETADAMEAAWKGVAAEFRPDFQWQTHSRDWIDFAWLTPDRQIEAIKRIADDAGYDRQVQQANADLIRSLRDAPDPDVLAHNCNVITREYSIERTGQKLLDAYEALGSSKTDGTVGSPSRAGTAVEHINRTRTFYPCRTEVIADV